MEIIVMACQIHVLTAVRGDMENAAAGGNSCPGRNHQVRMSDKGDHVNDVQPARIGSTYTDDLGKGRAL